MKKHVVLVEDDQIHAFIAERLLKKTDWLGEYTHCVNGKELFDWLVHREDDLPDLILLDINMPEWNAWDFLEARQAFPAWQNIPIYLVSSSTDRADRDRAEDFGLGQFYVVKPLTLSFFQTLFP